MAPAATVDPKRLTIYGRLSFPTWTAKAAFEKSQGGTYPAADISKAKPDFILLLEQAQLDKLMNHCVSTFLPYCEAQFAANEKRDKLEPDEVKSLIEQISDPAKWEKGVYNTPFKPVHEKTQPLAPEAVAQVKVIGNEGVDFELKAIVNSEGELLIPDPDLLKFPVLKPIDQTVHQMYAGCYVAVTINLYAYHNGKLPGFSAGASTAVFKADGDRFGGGVSVDEDEIFLD